MTRPDYIVYRKACAGSGVERAPDTFFLGKLEPRSFFDTYIDWMWVVEKVTLSVFFLIMFCLAIIL